MRKLAGAATLAVFAIAYAVLVVGNGFDRLSMYRSVDAAMVPELLKAQVLRQEAVAALRANRFGAAVKLAQEAVVRTPVEPASASMLGLAYFLSGKPTQAEAAFTVSGKLGWRDFTTQAYWLDRSLALGDYQSAVARLDAIMRTNRQLPASRQWLLRVERIPAARRELLIRLAEGPDWLGSYVNSSGELDPAGFAIRMDLVEAAAEMGRRPTCLDSVDTINAMAFRSGRFAEARRLWQVSCARNPKSGMIADPDFASDLVDLATPFDWNLPGVGGMESAITDGRLQLRNDTLLAVEAARQFVLLPPGRHRLSWRARASGSSEALQRIVKLYCPGEQDLVSLAGVSNDTSGELFHADIIVPATCLPQRLAIIAPEGSGAISIDSITVSPPGGTQ